VSLNKPNVSLRISSRFQDSGGEIESLGCAPSNGLSYRRGGCEGMAHSYVWYIALDNLPPCHFTPHNSDIHHPEI
jgi:hypothetical protein